MPLIPGTRLGSYEIVGSLGAGGMGEVYRAKDLRLGREVAVSTDSIAKVTMAVHSGKAIGLLVGFSLDALAVWAIVDAISHIAIPFPPIY